MSTTRNGDQTWNAYSKCGLTIETFSCFRKKMSISTKVLSNMPNVKFVFSHDERYCSSQSRLLENMNPKSLSLFDLYKNPKLIIPNTNQIFKIKILLPIMGITLLLELFNFIHYSLIQSETESRSTWNLEASDRSVTIQSNLGHLCKLPIKPSQSLKKESLKNI